MKELRRPDPAVQKMLPPQRPGAEDTYVRSVFAVPYEHEGRTLWFHTVTRQLIESERHLPERISSEEISRDEELTALMRGYYLVPESKDETASYCSLFQIFQTLNRRKGVRGFIILPTTACNARCVYCFEEGWKQVTMTPELTALTVEYIIGVRAPEEIHLSWFGGEPLAAVPVIDQICTGLRERDVPFTGSMITNGSLMTASILEKMTGLWNIKNVQVSMDGDEEDYIRRKRYARGSGHYQRVLGTVRQLAESGIRVTVRCNVDEENIDGADSFLQDLRMAVPEKENVEIWFSWLHQVRETERASFLWRKIAEKKRLVLSAGFQTGQLRLHDLRTVHCMADQGSVVVAPDGGLYACEDCPAESRIGSLAEGTEGTGAGSGFRRTDQVREKCRDCPFLPECTPFSACPHRVTACRETRRVIFEEQMRCFLEAPM